MLREPETPQRDADRWLTQLEARLDNVRPVGETTPAADPLGPMSLDAAPAAPPRHAVVLRRVVAAAPARQTVRTLSKSTPALPLFHPGGADWDEPLIKVPAGSARRWPYAARLTAEASNGAETGAAKSNTQGSTRVGIC